MHYVFILGTAGSGKSTLTAAFKDWLNQHDVYAISVNLDPGVAWLPYGPEVDARDYISFEKVMKEAGLGPNGALIACTDLLVNYVREIKEEIKSFNPDYVLVDTPGQVELFAFRETGPRIISVLRGERTSLLFLIDAMYASKPSLFASSLLLSASIFYRFQVPQLNVLSKIDLLSSAEREKIDRWLDDPHSLYGSVLAEKTEPYTLFTESVCDLLINLEAVIDTVFISSTTGEGLDNLYAQLQRMLAGGEDYVTY